MHLFTSFGVLLAIIWFASAQLQHPGDSDETSEEHRKHKNITYSTYDTWLRDQQLRNQSSQGSRRDKREARVDDYEDWTAYTSMSAPLYRFPQQQLKLKPSPGLIEHLDAVMKANATILPKLLVKGTELDSFFYGPDVAKTLRNYKVYAAGGFLVSSPKFSSIAAVVSFVESSPNTNNSYLAQVILQKSNQSPTTWKITGIEKCKNAECV